VSFFANSSGFAPKNVKSRNWDLIVFESRRGQRGDVSAPPNPLVATGVSKDTHG
jgi:hypothetical protein